MAVKKPTTGTIKLSAKPTKVNPKADTIMGLRIPMPTKPASAEAAITGLRIKQ